ncbi:MAG: indole-3-glycerol phosphate synthase TrpC [Planctomycetota bacterium]|jgi:indole-3-glycerol phosphate synthase
MGVLEDILVGVQEDLAARKAQVPEKELEALARDAQPRPSLIEALRAGDGPRVIAEVKRASPSEGAIREGLDPVLCARGYEANGAVAISVLTEGRRFGGSLADLRAVAGATVLPVLRKDFIVDRYQLLEAKAHGASAALLIVAALSPDQLKRLYGSCQEIGLDALVEVHDEEEATRAFGLLPELIGVNNRDLKTLKVSLETSRRLAPFLPAGAVKIAESGIARPGDIASLEGYGYDGFLVGGSLMKARDPGRALAALLRSPLERAP